MDFFFLSEHMNKLSDNIINVLVVEASGVDLFHLDAIAILAVMLGRTYKAVWFSIDAVS